MSSNQISASEAKFWTPMRVISSIIVFAALAIVGVSLFSSKGTVIVTNTSSLNANSTEPANNKANVEGNETPVVDPNELEQMPKPVMEAKVKNIKGKTFKLSDYKGKVLLLNLWATWCGPCRMEMPELVKLHEEFKGQDVEIIGLNISADQDTEQDIRNFIKRFNIPYTIGQADMDMAYMLLADNGSIPQTFLITRDGKLYRRFIGYGRSVPDKLRKSIQEALNFKS